MLPRAARAVRCTWLGWLVDTRMLVTGALAGGALADEAGAGAGWVAGAAVVTPPLAPGWAAPEALSAGGLSAVAAGRKVSGSR